MDAGYHLPMPEFTGGAADARRWLAVFAVCVAALFLLVNRPAYKSFFSDDDFDNLANARDADLKGFALTLVNPNTGGDGQFRATAYFYYYALVRWAGLRYVPYVAGIHALHFLNVLLLWWLARAMGAEIVGACGAALLYAFHAAAFDIYWKPMYVFDLMCATMTLASLLAYVRGWTVLSVVLFWLSLKSKEVTILFPLVLLVWEMVGERRVAWKRLRPFFVISAVVGGIAMGRNSGRDDAYTLRLTGGAVWQCVRYYSSRLPMIPYGGLGLAVLVLVAVWFARKQARVVWGVLAFVLLLGPLLVLPGRLFAAYLYTPMLGLAVAFSVVTRVRWLALFFLLWLPWNYWNFRTARREAQTIAEHRRAWFTPVAAFVRGHPEIDTFVYDGTPDAMPHHAVAGALRLLHPGPGIRVVPLERGWDALSAEHLAEFVWDPARLSLYLLPRVPDR